MALESCLRDRAPASGIGRQQGAGIRESIRTTKGPVKPKPRAAAPRAEPWVPGGRRARQAFLTAVSPHTASPLHKCPGRRRQRGATRRISHPGAGPRLLTGFTRVPRRNIQETLADESVRDVLRDEGRELVEQTNTPSRVAYSENKPGETAHAQGRVWGVRRHSGFLADVSDARATDMRFPPDYSRGFRPHSMRAVARKMLPRSSGARSRPTKAACSGTRLIMEPRCCLGAAQASTALRSNHPARVSTVG